VISLLDISLEKWPALIKELGGEPFRAQQLADWIFKKREFHFSRMTNMPAPLRKGLEEKYIVRSLLPGPVKTSTIDGTSRFFFDTHDGLSVTCVYLPYEDRRSLCLSTQVGCAWGCVFCASGKVPFQRNLTAGEMVDQILIVEQVMGKPLDSLLFMGMGEPLSNFTALVEALGVIRSKEALNFGARHVTVSTCGLVPQIKMLAEEAPKVNLAISLHSAFDETRKKLLPRASSWTVKEVVKAAKEFSIKTKAGVTFEYILIEGVNDSDQDAKRLGNMLRDMVQHGEYWVNLIAYNPVPGLTYKRPDDDKIEKFKHTLDVRGVPVRLRKPQGVDIGAGCGQLGEAR